MYTIEKTTYGLRVVMGGVYAENEIKQYIEEKEKLISEIDGPFSMLVDLRSAIPPEPSDRKLLEESQARMRKGNFERMAIIFTSPVLRMRGQQIAFDSEISPQTRMIDASKVPNWESLALDWVIKGIDPEATLGSRHQQGWQENQ